MSDFSERLEKAIERGRVRQTLQQKKAEDAKLNAEELKSLHTKYRLEFSEQIEKCIKGMVQHFPGFHVESLYGDKGWGAICYRDDFARLDGGRREDLYSRLEMVIRPHSDLNVLELMSKATIRNKELFNRNYFEKLEEASQETFSRYINAWVLEYAEQYAT